MADNGKIIRNGSEIQIDENGNVVARPAAGQEFIVEDDAVVGSLEAEKATVGGVTEETLHSIDIEEFSRSEWENGISFDIDYKTGTMYEIILIESGSGISTSNWLCAFDNDTDPSNYSITEYPSGDSLSENGAALMVDATSSGSFDVNATVATFFTNPDSSQNRLTLSSDGHVQNRKAWKSFWSGGDSFNEITIYEDNSSRNEGSLTINKKEFKNEI